MKKTERKSKRILETKILEHLVVNSLIRLLERGLITKEFDDRVLDLLRGLGVVMKKKSIAEYYLALQKFFGLSKEEFSEFPAAEKDFPAQAFFVLDEWIGTKDKSFVILNQGCYNYSGEEISYSYQIVDGKKIPKRTTYIAKYNDTPLALHVKCDKNEANIEAAGIYSPEFVCELEKRVNENFRKTYLGKTINHRLSFVDLKSYRREDLIYPEDLGKEVDDLVTTFHHWKKSKLVAKWGYMLIGAPGTGKTTVGGLVHQLKGNCTFLYCPAGNIGGGDIQRIFTLAKLLAPTILQIDDIDLIAKDRNEKGNSFTAELMENLDGLGEDKKIFLILTTNDPAVIERAIINRAGRVSSKIVFGGFGKCLPSLLKKYAEIFGVKLSTADVEAAIGKTEEIITEFTPDEVRNICERLYLLHGRRPIDSTQLEKAIREVYRAFHDPSIMKQYLSKTPEPEVRAYE